MYETTRERCRGPMRHESGLYHHMLMERLTGARIFHPAMFYEIETVPMASSHK